MVVDDRDVNVLKSRRRPGQRRYARGASVPVTVIVS